ncbi:NADPH-dependent F420 reductase [Caldivirga sp. UBA161]|uniref:NADPH-dependent F420 reductase n=1 Tax=Caldivirga sp. UBA161 TaxID=1915569 RepID=UPI0025BCF925|nr:NAD(P)-binding domain-containing protein [Caldivirga sp. UBA161]
MKIGVLGTGEVGRAIGTKLIQVGNEVMLGSRTRDNPAAVEWSRINGERAYHGTFAEAAAFGDVIFNCTNGLFSLDALRSAGEENLSGKILIDVANALEFSDDQPILTSCRESLAERIQQAFPEAKVVKTLNFVGYEVMVNPSLLKEGERQMLIAGNDVEAKRLVERMLKEWFGWEEVMDLGDIKAAKALEMLVPLWFRVFETMGTTIFGFKVVPPHGVKDYKRKTN